VSARLGDVLTSMAERLVVQLEADACAISRVIGDVLILVTEQADEGQSLQLGQGYLVSEYPQTGEVLESGRPRTLTLDDGDVDEAEASVLRALGFGSLLMMRLDLHGEAWGLVEVYRRGARPFDTDDVRAALELIRLP
jgi:hypothetical protein